MSAFRDSIPDVVKKAADAAQDCLRLIRYSGSGPVRLSKLAKRLAVLETRKRTGSSTSVEGSLWIRRTPLGFDGPEADIEVAFGESRIGRMRYTVAHELAHQYARLSLPEDLTKHWQPRDVRVFCDSFAAQLLTPDGLLAEEIRRQFPHLKSTSRGSLAPGIQDIETLHRRLRVPMSTVLLRLSEYAARMGITLDNIMLEVTAQTSLRKKENYAPRVLAACTARRWYIPRNKRLSTLGLSNLASAFWGADTLTEGRVYDRVTVFERGSWRKYSWESVIAYKIFASRPANRVMLAVFGVPSEMRSI
jgi:hypothetical protein